MSSKSIKNIAASVHQRLLNQAKIKNRSFNEWMQYYAMERFLYRLSCSQHASLFILKGAFMLSVWRLSEVRTTMDIDMLGKGSHLAKNIIRQIQDIILTDVVDDGLLFDVDSLQTQSITEDTDSPGIRVTFLGKLNTMRIKMQIDIGFGDVVFPTIEKSLIPTLLDFPAPMLLCYSRETLIAEKFEAMVKLGGFNTRMKDFYDIWLLSRQYNFTKDILATAIRKTFAQRGTAVPMEIKILSMEFAASKQSLWASFRKRLQQDSIPEDFYEVVAHLKMFLEPYLV